MAQTTLHDYLQQTAQAISSGRLDDALEHCQHILRQFPETLEAQRLLGKVYMAQGYLEEAQQTLDWVLTNDPENVVAYCDRAMISERISDVDTALDCYQQAYELSRGDGHIRREFNQLSIRAGQPGFMLSRAGLARLYMRGDLLTEAIQEWEVVLAANSERLDARLGLMETCWYEGQYERAEQLARQILQDVPGCLKALILLAFFVSLKNIQETRELIQRAEALDPELSMARELFKDMQASQPDHPFFQFLRKEPIFITDTAAKSDEPISTSAVVNKDNAISTSAVVNKDNAMDALVAANTLPQWSDMDNWNGIDTLDNSRLQAPAETSNHLNGLSNDDQNNLEQEQDVQPAPVQDYSFDASESWDSSSEERPSFASNTWSASVEEKQAPAPPSWLNMLTQNEPQQASEPVSKASEQSEETIRAADRPVTLEPVDQKVSSQPTYVPEFQMPAQAVIEDEEEGSFFGPEWLKSLGAASFDTDGPANETPAVTSPSSTAPSFSEPEEEFIPQPTFEPWQESTSQPEPVFESWPSQNGWSEPALESRHSPSTASEPVFESWQPEQAIEQPATVQSSTAQSAFEAAPTPTQEPVAAEESWWTTLEGLESDLHSQGFVPLEPNSLSSIAQSRQEVSHEQVAPALGVAQPVQSAQEEEEPQEEEPTLPSALAELSNMGPRTAPTSITPASPSQSYRQAASPTPEDEPSWLASFRTTPAPEPVVPQEPPVTRRMTTPLQPAASMQPGSPPQVVTPVQKAPPQQPAQRIQPEPSMQPVQPVRLAPELPVPAPMPGQSVRVDTLPGPVFTPTHETAIPSKKLPEPVRVPAARADVGFSSDLELETTMKRPAVRLQSMQAQRNTTASPPDQASLANRARSSERPIASKPEASRSGDVKISYRDRLVKGYQHQLVGNYDEAMQEYRVLIRNAPELLSEVVSNVRALLKLAPKYSAGYRVLGDAYMRQGEYLQAMEAYNKALTMAKKAKA